MKLQIHLQAAFRTYALIVPGEFAALDRNIVIVDRPVLAYCTAPCMFLAPQFVNMVQILFCDGSRGYEEREATVHLSKKITSPVACARLKIHQCAVRFKLTCC